MALVTLPAMSSYGAVESITFSAHADAQVTTANPDANYGSDPTGSFGRLGDWYFAFLMRFNLSGIPSDAKISSAHLVLFGDYATEGTQTYGIWMVDGSWDESSVTLNGPWGTISDSLSEFQWSGESTRTYIELEGTMTQIVKRWFENREANRGIVIGIPNNRPAGESIMVVATREAGNSDHHPQLIVQYERTNPRRPTGVSATDGTFDDRVRISWNGVPNVDGYEVWRNTSNNPSTAENLFFTVSTEGDDTSAVRGETYYYWVRSFNFIDGDGYRSEFGSPNTGYAGSIDPETVSPPPFAIRPETGKPNETLDFLASGAISSFGHPVEYQFDWGLGESNYSTWGSGRRSISYPLPGTYRLRGRARCMTHPNIVSAWQEFGTITIGLTGTQENQEDFLVTAPGTEWISALSVGSPGFSSILDEGLCIEVSETGDKSGQWISPYGFIDLAPMKVYRIRVRVRSNNATPGRTPMWGILIDNFSNDNPPSVIENKYGLEQLFLDNLGGANSAGLGSSVGSNDFEVWFTPLAVSATDWNNQMFTPEKDAINDARVQFRVVDFDNTGYGGELDSGRVCIESIDIDSFNLDDLELLQSVYSVNTISNGRIGGSHTVGGTIPGSTIADFINGDVIVRPDRFGALGDDAWDNELINFTPGDTELAATTDPSKTPDNFPIVDESDGIYKVTMGVRAPDALSETNPPDAIRVGMDDVSTEVLMVSNILATTNAIGMPKANSGTEYTAFYHSNNLTLSDFPNMNRIRPRADILCNENISLNGQQDNLGGVTLSYMTVEKVARPLD